MKILFVASEATPWAKVGGLADVVGSLSKALANLGHEIRLIIPKYGSIDLSSHLVTSIRDNFKIEIMAKKELANLLFISGKVPVYMVENNKYFGGKEIYSENDLERFLFFSKAVFEILPQLDWQPEIVHCHDWHTALIPLWQKEAGYPYVSLFTIHNLAYQGFFDENFLALSGLKKYWQAFPLQTLKLPLNFMSQGILHADLVTTVSETYAKEIVTPEYGEGLDPLLRYRQKDLIGIINGIDYEEYNPATDPYLVVNYDSSTLHKRIANKLALQQRSNLPQDAEIPLIGMVQRLDEQKGFDILEKAIDVILEKTKTQIIILGKGREYYENMLRQIASRYPQQIALFIRFDNPLAHLIYAGCDMFLMPSRFEPCGLGQLISMRYGALPIVRHTGGLVDTVLEFTPDLKEGSGFVFKDYTPEALIAIILKAVNTFKNQKTSWYKAMQRVMELDFSWRASAKKYEKIYEESLKRKKYVQPQF